MERLVCWGTSIALLAILLSTGERLRTTATVLSSTTSAKTSLEAKSTSSQKPDTVQLAQGLIGQCRAVARSIFVYSERSTANPLRALQADEQVFLAEESGRGGWIAISSPINGFVQAKDLKPCPGQEVGSPPSPPNRCRRVIYERPEGLTIRERPDQNSPRVGGVFFGDSVTLDNPPQFRLDNQGREWVRITAPTAGWMSNGFPATGEINLRACF